MAMYLTVQEFRNAPTAIDCNSLVPGGTVAQNDAELTNIIRRASSWVNQLCKMPTLEASSNTETKEVCLNNAGVLRIHPNMVPIISLADSIKYKVTPNSPWVPLSIAATMVFDRYFMITNLIESITFPNTSYRTPYAKWNMKNSPIIIQYTYVNGYPNTVLTEDCLYNTNTIKVKSVTGMVNQTLTIYDGDRSEDVVISSVVGDVVTLKSPMIFGHTAGIAVSALPDSVKQATILLAAYLINERGSLSISMGEQSMQGLKHSIGTDVSIAKEMLRPFVRGVVS